MIRRREFLLTTAASAVTAATLPARLRAAPPPADSAPNPIIGFSKPFLQMGPSECADWVAQVGWSGIEIPVRAKGQIEPSRVRDQLPAFVEAFQKRGLDIPVVVSDITNLRPKWAEGVIRQSAVLGIKRIRLGFWRYDTSKPILPQVDAVAADLKEIGALCQEVGIEAGVENHSGANVFGGPIWDIVRAIGDTTKNVGIFFDIGHATIEGGLSWPIEAQLARPHFVGIYVKDFSWQKIKGKWTPKWCPLGEGQVDPGFLKTLKTWGYSGPIVQHHEYPLGDRNSMLKYMRKDLATLQSWLGQVSGSPFA